MKVGGGGVWSCSGGHLPPKHGVPAAEAVAPGRRWQGCCCRRRHTCRVRAGGGAGPGCRWALPLPHLFLPLQVRQAEAGSPVYHLLPPPTPHPPAAPVCRSVSMLPGSYPVFPVSQPVRGTRAGQQQKQSFADRRQRTPPPAVFCRGGRVGSTPPSRGYCQLDHRHCRCCRPPPPRSPPLPLSSASLDALVGLSQCAGGQITVYPVGLGAPAGVTRTAAAAPPPPAGIRVVSQSSARALAESAIRSGSGSLPLGTLSAHRPSRAVPFEIGWENRRDGHLLCLCL